MFSWPANRVKPKMKATYTRKKTLNSPYSTDQIKEANPHTEVTTMSIQGDNNDDVEDSTGHISMDVAPPSRIGSGIQSKDGSIMVSGDVSVATSDVANALDTQLLKETSNRTKELSEDEEQMYDVEYFMADDYKMFPQTNTPQKALLTKWAGFDRIDELTWEPESEMREDVLHLVEAYYTQKVKNSSQEATKPSRGRPSKVTKASSGRPPKDANAPRGRGRPPKAANAQHESQLKNGQGRRGRPPKAANTQQVSQPKSSQGRRGQPPRARPAEQEQN